MKKFTPLLVAITLCLSEHLAAQLPPVSSAAKGNESLFGIFEGKSPCQEIAKLLKVPVSSDCIKSKWRLTLYNSTLPSQLHTYVLEGSFYRRKPREGTWTIIRGIKTNPEATVIQLDPDKPGDSLFLLKADENVLFILDGEMNLLAGNEDFSYTLNRAK